METITITKDEYIGLLEYKLDALKKAQSNDSSWNYNIEELELQIESLKYSK